jgi:CCR4-NOT transcriptional regulation complex NOT5 subunit
MRKIYNRYSEVLYCIRDDGTITDKWDVDVIGHLHSDRITDKFDIDTLFRIRSDGTITDKWDVDIIGHIRSDGTITDK